MLSLKSGVEILGLRPEAVLGVLVVSSIYQEFGRNCTLTSVTDGVHRRNSLHYAGCAFDVRIHHLGANEREMITNAIREALGANFDVVLESTHIHVEFQPEGPPQLPSPPTETA